MLEKDGRPGCYSSFFSPLSAEMAAVWIVATIAQLEESADRAAYQRCGRRMTRSLTGG